MKSLSFPKRVLSASFAAALWGAAVSAAPPEGLRWSDFAGLKGPNPQQVARPAATAPHVFPQRSILQVIPMEARTPGAVALQPVQAPNTRGTGTPAYIMAHLAPGATMWIGDAEIISDAAKPAYEIPVHALEAGSTYYFTVRVQWGEDGKWVTQSHKFALKAGEVHCVQIALSESPELKKQIADNIAKLGEADRKAAEAQKFCAVQSSIKLGSMGAPVKVAVNGKDVFLCCEACKTAALKDADKTLKTVESLKADKVKASEPK